MADLVRQQLEGVPRDMRSRYRDMGDGTHALVVSSTINGAVTVAEPVTVDGTVNVGTVVNPVTVTGATTTTGYVGLLDETATPYGVKQINGKPRVSAMPYTYDIAEGNVAGHTSWSVFGYTPTLGLTESDLWSAAGVYVFPAAAQQMEVVSSDNTQDIGTVIKGDAVGNTVQSDPDGTTTTLTDADVDFTAATAVAAGDLVILDPHGTSPSFGFVTGVAAHTLTVAGGFVKGDSAASRYYAVIDKSAHTGALAVGIQYLDANYTRRGEIVVLNGTTPVDTVGTGLLRINDMRVIGTGSNNKPVGNISLRNTAGTTTYSHITLGYNMARDGFYTVPANLTLYIVQMTPGFGYAANQTHYARIYLRANKDTIQSFNMGSIFYPFAEVVCANTSTPVEFVSPLVFPQRTDIRVSGIASTATGIATVALRGWME